MRETRVAFSGQAGARLSGTLTEVANSKDVTVFLHGYKRSSDEVKFKVLASELAKVGISSFRFDMVGYANNLAMRTPWNFTFGSFVRDLEAAVQWIERSLGITSRSAFAHSLGACVVALYEQCVASTFKKVVFMALALNQRELMRYWYAQSKEPLVTWETYSQHVDAEGFDKWLDSPYRRAASHIDLRTYAAISPLSFMCVHAYDDQKVPWQSVDAVMAARADRLITPAKGGHDLEDGASLKLWMREVVRFLQSR